MQVLASLALVAACGHADVAHPATAARPRLVVLVVIDQLPMWSFERKAARAHAGIARILRDGVLFADARYPYATTATSVGHAALTSGAAPDRSGIIGNKWFDRDEGEIEVIEDPRYPALLAGTLHPGTTALAGISPRRLGVESVGDALVRATRGAARAVTVSIKPRAATMMGGQHPTLAVWYEPAQTAFTTSRYYAEQLPPWLAELARAAPIAPRLGSYTWTPLDPAGLAAATGVADDASGERGKLGLMGATFPHLLASAKEPAEAVEATPLADELLLEAVLAALPGEQLGTDDVPDLLCISFSAHDYIGHGWGPDSWESADDFARLDVVIGRLLDALDARVGRDRWALVLASDHGGTRVPEQTGGGAAHVDPDTFRAPLEAAARATVGDGDWIAFVSEQWVYLSAAGRALAERDRERLLDALVETLRRQPGVAVALRTDRVRGECERRTGMDALVCRSAHERVGEVFWAPPPGSVAMKLPWDASNHISPNIQDRVVPVVVVAPGAPRGVVVRREVSTLQVAATLASLLGVPPPRDASRRDPLPFER